MKIEVKNLNKKLKNIDVIKNVNVVFKSGKIYGITGRNGSGKSVFLKLLCSFYVPDSGSIIQDGFNYTKENTFPKNTRALIEGPNFIGSLTGFENLKLLAKIQNKITDNDIEDILKRVNLYKEKDKKYNEYSLGMKQKLGIAQTLMEDPKVIILDEPFNGLEQSTVKVVKEILKSEKEKNKIIILTSHIKEDIEELSDEIYEFDNGVLTKKC